MVLPKQPMRAAVSTHDRHRRQFPVAAGSPALRLPLILPTTARKYEYVKKARLVTRAFVAACALAVGSLPALAADRWQEAGAGAVAILPAPKAAVGIEGGSLYCIEQSWAFLFRLTPDSGLLAGNVEKAKLAASDQTFDLDALISPLAAKVAVPRGILFALKDGSGLKVEIGAGKGAPKAIFNLRYSRQVLDAIAPRCSQIDMSAYTSVSLSPTDAAVEQATGLLESEIKLFREFTGKSPVVSSVVLTLADDKRLMFASLCGSHAYYGDSGCSTAGYAADGAESVWKQVYETDGVLLYTDPKQSTDGWPNLVTLPVVGGTEPTHWVWTGEGYQLLDQILSGDNGVQEQGDAAAQ